MTIDAHTHLNGEQLFPNWKTYLKDFQDIGGKILVNAGANAAYNTNGILIAKEAKTLFPELIVKATIGIHPEEVKEEQVSDFGELIADLEQQYLEHQEEVIAIGECGIDLHFPDNARLEVQQKLLQLQAELARKLQLPIVIHSRDGFEETIEVLKEFSDLKMYFHSRGYGKVALEKAESLFPSLWIGFNNIISYPNAHQTRESLLAAKKAHILIETDAPYLPPQVFRGQRNYPEYVSYVYEKCAELLEMKQVELEEMIRENFERFVQ